MGWVDLATLGGLLLVYTESAVPCRPARRCVSEISCPRSGAMLALLAHLATVSLTLFSPSIGPTLLASRSCGLNAFKQQNCCRTLASEEQQLSNRAHKPAQPVRQPLRENLSKIRCVGREQSAAQVAISSPRIDFILFDASTFFVGGNLPFHLLALAAAVLGSSAATTIAAAPLLAAVNNKCEVDERAPPNPQKNQKGAAARDKCAGQTCLPVDPSSCAVRGAERVLHCSAWQCARMCGGGCRPFTLSESWSDLARFLPCPSGRRGRTPSRYAPDNLVTMAAACATGLDRASLTGQAGCTLVPPLATNDCCDGFHTLAAVAAPAAASASLPTPSPPSPPPKAAIALFLMPLPPSPPPAAAALLVWITTAMRMPNKVSAA